jgi:RNA polymerase sigma-70 factor (ECF subfamily)
LHPVHNYRKNRKTRRKTCKKSPGPDNYEAVTAAIARGSEDFMTDWSQILETHGRIVWKTVNRFIDDDADAADCFQDTFLAVLEFSRKNQIRNWPGLLKRLATTNALAHLRKGMRKSIPSVLPGDPAEVSDSARQPPEVAEGQELFACLREGLAALPQEQAEACCLRFLEGLSYAEIAEELNITVNHVGVLLNRAKVALRQNLLAFAPPS